MSQNEFYLNCLLHAKGCLKVKKDEFPKDESRTDEWRIEFRTFEETNSQSRLGLTKAGLATDIRIIGAYNV